MKDDKKTEVKLFKDYLEFVNYDEVQGRTESFYNAVKNMLNDHAKEIASLKERIWN